MPLCMKVCDIVYLCTIFCVVICTGIILIICTTQLRNILVSFPFTFLIFFILYLHLCLFLHTSSFSSFPLCTEPAQQLEAGAQIEALGPVAIWSLPQGSGTIHLCCYLYILVCVHLFM